MRVENSMTEERQPISARATRRHRLQQLYAVLIILRSPRYQRRYSRLDARLRCKALFLPIPGQLLQSYQFAE